MEPRVFTRGNGQQREPFSGVQSASMEPRVFTRGNNNCPRPGARSTNGFNGATRLHAWKLQDWEAGNAPITQLQWSHASSRVETRIGQEPVEEDNIASMEPRVFTR